MNTRLHSLFRSHLSRITCLLCLLSFLLYLLPAPALAATPPPELTVLRQQYDKAYAERVTTVFDASKAALDAKFTAALDNAIATAKTSGDLPTVLAIQEDKKAIEAKQDLPADDAEGTPEALKNLRTIYREQLAKLTEQRTANATALLAPYSAKLQALEATLTKADRVDEAKEVMDYRVSLKADAQLAPTVAATTPAPPGNTPLPPTATVPKVKGDDRKAAEWILANWSDFRLFIDDHQGVSKAEGLPKGKFTIESIAIDGRFYTGGTLTGEALQVLAGLQELKSFTMGNFPDLKDEDLAFIGTLNSLEELKLSKLPCTDAVMTHFKNLKKLQAVEFGEMKNLTGTGFAQLQENEKLERIIHWKGGMTDDGVAAIAKLPGITTLDMQSNTAVTDSCIAHLQKMDKLTNLQFTASSLTLEGFAGVVMPKIKMTAANELSKLPLSQIAPKMATVFPNVETYFLSYFARTPEDLVSLAHYKKLKALAFVGNVTDEAWPGMLELRDLESFRTYSHEMSTVLWQTLAKLKKLKHVQYGSKPPDAAALAAFKKERPDVKVEP